MKKFKVGDMVRRIVSDNGVGAQVGQTARVVRVDGAEMVWVDYPGMVKHSKSNPYEGWCFCYAELVVSDTSAHDRAIAIIQAHKEGKVVQQQTAGGTWIDYTRYGVPRMVDPQYWRIKPEPLECWTVFDPDGLPMGSFPSRTRAEGSFQGYPAVHMVEKL